MLAPLPAFNKSHTSTRESSAPLASMPRRLGFHSMELRAAECPRSSRSAVPGCRASRMRTMLESAAKVARRWASCGDAARRRSGGAGLRVWAGFVGDAGVGEETASRC